MRRIAVGAAIVQGLRQHVSEYPNSCWRILRRSGRATARLRWSICKNEPAKLALIARGLLPADETERPRTGGSGPLLPTDLLEGQRLEGIGRLAESNTGRFVAQPVSAPDGLWRGVRASIRTHQPARPESQGAHAAREGLPFATGLSLGRKRRDCTVRDSCRRKCGAVHMTRPFTCVQGERRGPMTADPSLCRLALLGTRKRSQLQQVRSRLDRHRSQIQSEFLTWPPSADTRTVEENVPDDLPWFYRWRLPSAIGTSAWAGITPATSSRKIPSRRWC
jgi:hypothetical protein